MIFEDISLLDIHTIYGEPRAILGITQNTRNYTRSTVAGVGSEITNNRSSHCLLLIRWVNSFRSRQHIHNKQLHLPSPSFYPSDLYVKGDR